MFCHFVRCVGNDTHFSLKNEKLDPERKSRVDERVAPKKHSTKIGVLSSLCLDLFFGHRCTDAAVAAVSCYAGRVSRALSRALTGRVNGSLFIVRVKAWTCYNMLHFYSYF
jgi:hypothetical protein